MFSSIRRRLRNRFPIRRAKLVRTKQIPDTKFIDENPNATFEEIEKNQINVNVYEATDNGSTHLIEDTGAGFEAETVSGNNQKFIVGNVKSKVAEIRVTGDYAGSGLMMYWNRDEGHLKTFGEDLKIQPDFGDVYIGNTQGDIYLTISNSTFKVTVGKSGPGIGGQAGQDIIKFEDTRTGKTGQIILTD